MAPTSRHRARRGGRLARGVIPPHRARFFRSLTRGPSQFSSMKITPAASSAARNAAKSFADVWPFQPAAAKCPVRVSRRASLLRAAPVELGASPCVRLPAPRSSRSASRSSRPVQPRVGRSERNARSSSLWSSDVTRHDGGPRAFFDHHPEAAIAVREIGPFAFAGPGEGVVGVARR